MTGGCSFTAVGACESHPGVLSELWLGPWPPLALGGALGRQCVQSVQSCSALCNPLGRSC